MSRFLYTLIFLSAFSFTPFFSKAQWTNVGPAASNGWTIYNDIAVDTSGAPVIVYHTYSDYTSPCLKFDQGLWQQVGAASYNNFPVGDNLKLLIDKKNNYILFFMDSINSFPSVVRFDGSSWNTVGAASVVSEVVSAYTIAIDTAGRVYCGYSTSTGFKIARENGSVWENIVTSGLPINTLAFPDISFNRNNELYIAYNNTNTLKACCMKFTGSGWVPVGNQNFSSGYAQYTKLVITDQNYIYVGFQESATRVMRYNSSTGTWVNAGQTGLGGNYTGIDDLIADRHGRLFLSTSQVASDRARCFMYEGSTWTQLGATGISDTTAGYINIALAGNGDLYATYNDFIARRAYVKVFQGASSTNVQPTESNIALYPNPSSGHLKVRFDNTEEEHFYIQIRNMAGAVCKEAIYQPDSGDLYLNIEGLSNGIYTVIIKSENTARSVKLVKI